MDIQALAFTSVGEEFRTLIEEHPELADVICDLLFQCEGIPSGWIAIGTNGRKSYHDKRHHVPAVEGELAPMTVIQKLSRSRTIAIVQERIRDLSGCSRSEDWIQAQLVFCEALGLIEFEPEAVKERAIKWLSDPKVAHDAALLASNNLSISGGFAVALIEVLERGGFKIVRA